MSARCYGCLDNDALGGAIFCEPCWAMVDPAVKERFPNKFPPRTEALKNLAERIILEIRDRKGRWKKRSWV